MNFPARRHLSRRLRHVFFLVVALIMRARVCDAQESLAPVGDMALRTELLSLGREDQADRKGFSDAMKSNDAAYADRLVAADSARTARLRAIVAKHGWPTVALVGRDGVNAAWLVLQHTPDASWQRDMLPVLEGAAGAGELPRADLALFTDRVLVQQGLPQRYGSSFAVVAGRLVAAPIEDEGRVDVRRAVGLPSMADYAKLLAEIYTMPVEWPRRRE